VIHSKTEKYIELKTNGEIRNNKSRDNKLFTRYAGSFKKISLPHIQSLKFMESLPTPRKPPEKIKAKLKQILHAKSINTSKLFKSNFLANQPSPANLKKSQIIQTSPIKIVVSKKRNLNKMFVSAKSLCTLAEQNDTFDFKVNKMLTGQHEISEEYQRMIDKSYDIISWLNSANS